MQTAQPLNKIATLLENAGKRTILSAIGPELRIKGSQSAQMRQDLTVSGFVLALVFVGVIVAAHTDRPVFWLLIGPAPFAVLHTVRTFLQQRMNRREGLLESYERNR